MSRRTDMADELTNRLAAALDSDDLAEIDAALAALDEALPEAEERAEEARRAALDPRAGGAELTRRKKAAEELAFTRDRLDNTRLALGEHRDQVAAEQAEALRCERHAAAEREKREVLDAFEERWDQLVEELVTLACRLEDASDRAAAANRDLPAGAEKINDPRAAAAHHAVAEAKIRTRDHRASIAPALGGRPRIVLPAG